MTDIIVIAVVAVIVGLAVFYIVRAKKKGVKCIGCPQGGKCSDRESCTGCCAANEN